ncbi:hypothetical protein G6M50_06170 [Agrobacterium rhizogenes]|nr:hypothetical protein [Rhizobium rhizogenes]NTJ77388.1 hypothetical protein [Rhizobium rhizogenes]
MKAAKAHFENEAALCSQFISSIPAGWTAYPETAGFDIVLVRNIDGAQIGIEAKMTLNAKVLMQAVDGIYTNHGDAYGGPDWRAALVPAGAAGAEMKQVARYLGVTIIECQSPNGRAEYIEREVARSGEEWRKWAEKDADRNYHPFRPELPSPGYQWREMWVDFCPAKRLPLPEYVPDVTAGASGPTSLSEWKIKAIKIAIILERRGYLTPKDFAHISIDRKRWHDMGWISHDAAHHVRGRFVTGPTPLDLRAAHPVNYLQIEADWEKWAPKEASEELGALL